MLRLSGFRGVLSGAVNFTRADSTMSTSIPLHGAPVACSNCCELLFTMTQTDSVGCYEDHGFDSRPVYELTQGDEILPISSVLERIYRFAQLRDFNDSEETPVDHTPLCPNCANILNQMNTLHQEFDRLRRFESYLSTKINEVDEIIRNQIAHTKLQLINNVDCQDSGKAHSGNYVVKTEPEETSKTALSVGPWVLLKRLRPEDIPNQHQADPEEVSSMVSADDDSSDYFPEVDFEPSYNEEKETVFNTCDDDNVTVSSTRRVSKRNATIAASKYNHLVENVEITAENTNETKKRTVKTNSLVVDKGRKKKPAKKSQSRKVKKRGPRTLRIVEFYRRKLVHPSPCYYCQENFNMESERVEHLREVHCTTQQCVICPPCGKLFTSEQGRKLHEPKCGYIPPHYVMPPYICDDCGKEFNKRWNLQSHKKNVHNTERPFGCDQLPVECPECHKILKSQPVFEDHFKRMHTSEGFRIYREINKRRSAKKSEIRRRNRITTSVCVECNIDFQTVVRYKAHWNEVHVDTNKWKWQCEQCGKGFNNSWIFKSHIKFVHTDERPFICDQCGMRFKSPKNLNAHLERVHTEEGRLKYNEYSKVNYRRKQKLAQELLKAKETSTNPISSALKVPATATVVDTPDKDIDNNSFAQNKNICKSAVKMKLNLVFYGILTCLVTKPVLAYKPVVIVHGILDHRHSLQSLGQRIMEVRKKGV
ncbi:unnamed protein product [Allacma fusca]|uniref:C2H2-type domain-containing protein n=1 Tax=Allacma fusca TaxID=39272 RepID=A0A8J2PCJ1_9HEXA|nr:unnamed protein product [Allacma fusca]